jgi:hypothetical protein
MLQNVGFFNAISSHAKVALAYLSSAIIILLVPCQDSGTLNQKLKFQLFTVANISTTTNTWHLHHLLFACTNIHNQPCTLIDKP